MKCLMLVALLGACSLPSAPSVPVLSGQYLAHEVGPFTQLRAVLGTNDGGAVYGTVYADLANCHSARPLDCSLMGAVVPGSVVRADGSVTVLVSFEAYHFDLTLHGSLRDGAIVGTVTETELGNTSVPVTVRMVP